MALLCLICLAEDGVSDVRGSRSETAPDPSIGANAARVSAEGRLRPAAADGSRATYSRDIDFSSIYLEPGSVLCLALGLLEDSSLKEALADADRDRRRDMSGVCRQCAALLTNLNRALCEVRRGREKILSVIRCSTRPADGQPAVPSRIVAVTRDNVAARRRNSNESPAGLSAGGGYENDAGGGYENDAGGGYENDAGGGYENDAGGGYENDAGGGYENDAGDGYENDAGGAYENDAGCEQREAVSETSNCSAHVEIIRYDSSRSAAEHPLPHTQVADRPVAAVCACHLCGGQFSTQTALRSHISRLHGNAGGAETTPPGLLQCAVCQRVFRSASSLRAHGRLHDDARALCCPHCPQRYSSRPDLLQHVARHTGARPFICPQCNNTYRFRSNLTHHMQTAHGRLSLPCPVCHKRFNMAKKLKRHQMSMHGELRFECSVCDRRFTQQTQLRRHLQGAKHRPGAVFQGQADAPGPSSGTQAVSSSRGGRRVGSGRFISSEEGESAEVDVEPVEVYVEAVETDADGSQMLTLVLPGDAGHDVEDIQESTIELSADEILYSAAEDSAIVSVV